MSSLLPSPLQLSLASLGVSLILYRFFTSRKAQSKGPSSLNGPKPESWLWGNLARVEKPETVIADNWTVQYGNTFSVAGFLCKRRLYTLDPTVIGHVLSKPADFAKPWQSRIGLLAITGPGLVASEGDVHKRQRKILNPVFAASQIRGLTPLFLQKARQLRDLWLLAIVQERPETPTIDVLRGLGHATLDVIGEAGFGYPFNAILDESNELSHAFHDLFNAVTSFKPLDIFQLWFPMLAVFPTKAIKSFRENSETLHRIGKSIIDEKLRQISQSEEDDVKEELRGKDLLSVLVKSNLSEAQESQKMSDDEVRAQIATFIAAGHETSGTVMTWAVHSLATNQEAQRKLRAELLAFPHDDPSMEELNSLPYLDWVTRETLRLNPPVELTSRQAWRNEVVPLGEPVTDRHGNVQRELHLVPGDVVFIPIREINLSKAVWGDNAREFIPERWENVPAAANALPSVYSNTLTFLAGPRACIGWRMALVEIKAFLFVLVRSVEFGIDADVIMDRKLGIAVTRPIVQGKEASGCQMPLRVSKVSRS